MRRVDPTTEESRLINGRSLLPFFPRLEKRSRGKKEVEKYTREVKSKYEGEDDDFHSFIFVCVRMFYFETFLVGYNFGLRSNLKSTISPDTSQEINRSCLYSKLTKMCPVTRDQTVSRMMWKIFKMDHEMCKSNTQTRDLFTFY